jgi:hypothetical protein
MRKPETARRGQRGGLARRRRLRSGHERDLTCDDRPPGDATKSVWLPQSLPTLRSPHRLPAHLPSRMPATRRGQGARPHQTRARGARPPSALCSLLKCRRWRRGSWSAQCRCPSPLRSPCMAGAQRLAGEGRPASERSRFEPPVDGRGLSHGVPSASEACPRVRSAPAARSSSPALASAAGVCGARAAADDGAFAAAQRRC